MMAAMSRQGALWVCLHCVWFLHQAESNSFVGSPGVVRVDVNGSAALEWTLESEPGSHDQVSIKSNDADVFRYEPYTGVISKPVTGGAGGNTNASYDPRFAIYNTSTRGVGFRLAGLGPDDAGTYTCIYETLDPPPITMDVVLFVYDLPGRPVIELSPQTLVEGKANVSLQCNVSSTSLPVAHRPAMLYTWSRNVVDIDRTAPPERHAVLGDSGQMLEISPVHHTDIAYTCTASENGTQLTSEETNVTLDILHEPYNVKSNPEKPSASENKALKITGSADCNPACNYTWYIGDDVISHGPLLEFETFQFRDASNYTVRAQNTYGTAELMVEVTLNTSPSEHTTPGAKQFWTTDKFIMTGASAAAGGLVLLIIIILVAVCCARRRRKKKDGDASVEDLVPYGSTTANGTQCFTNEAVAADQGNAPYAEVGKEQNRVGKPATKQDVEAHPPVIYAQVNKTKKGKKEKKEGDDDINGGPEPVLYAQVDKNRPRKGKDKTKENGQRDVPDELTEPVPSHYDDVEVASAPVPDHVTSVAEDPYAHIASASQVNNNNEEGQGHPLRTPKKVQGFTYSELTFAKDTEARPEVIHSKEPPTEYSKVHFKRTAPPSN